MCNGLSQLINAIWICPLLGWQLIGMRASNDEIEQHACHIAYAFAWPPSLGHPMGQPASIKVQQQVGLWALLHKDLGPSAAGDLTGQIDEKTGHALSTCCTSMATGTHCI